MLIIITIIIIENINFFHAEIESLCDSNESNKPDSVGEISFGSSSNENKGNCNECSAELEFFNNDTTADEYSLGKHGFHKFQILTRKILSVHMENER